VNEEYAARTACRDHSKICTKELRGSISRSFYSDCEARRLYGGCKFSHTIFNTQRVLKLGAGSENFVVELRYGYGFERYGSYEGWSSGWDVIVNGRDLGSGGSDEKTYNLPKSLLLAEHRLGTKARGDPEVNYGKVQTICKANDDHGACNRPDCRFDHNLVDSKRIESLVRWPNQSQTPDHEYMAIECRVEGGRAVWKITLKPDAFVKIPPGGSIARTLPPRPFSHEYQDLLGAIRHVETVVGLTKAG